MLKKVRSSALDRILGKVDELDEKNLAALVTRLSRERRLLETIFNTIRDAILVADLRGIIQYANHPARLLLGLNQREIGKTLLLRRLPGLAVALGVAELGDLIEGSALSTEFAISYPEERDVSAYLVPLDEAADSFESGGFLVLLSDITEQRHRTREQIETERLNSITMLAAGVAHELGNPLNSILIHLQIAQRHLRREPPESASDGALRSLEICLQEVDRLDSILSNFLRAVRPTEPDLREINLWSILNEILEVQSQTFEDRGINIDVEIDQSVPLVNGDPTQIKQVFYNIIKNAAEAMYRGGILQISSEVTPQDISLRFQDEGEGIDAEDLSRVFQPYFTTKEGGHGLGMMIVQRIMDDHRGSITIQSERGKGTTVSLRFPRHTPLQPLLESAQGEPDAPPRQSLDS